MAWKKTPFYGALALFTLAGTTSSFAGDADIKLPSLQNTSFLGGSLSGQTVLFSGLAVCIVGALFGIFQYRQIRALPVHKSMGDVSHIIWETCKTYLFQQGKFLAALWVLIAICMVYYFKVLQEKSLGSVAVILASSILGILGSYGVADTEDCPEDVSKPLFPIQAKQHS